MALRLLEISMKIRSCWRYEKMMGRLEKRYCWIMDILAWGHGKYTKEQLEQLTMPELAEIHSQVYNQRLDEIQSVHL